MKNNLKVKLLAKDANDLAKLLLQSIVIDDDLTTTDDDGNGDDESEGDTEHETDVEDGNDVTIIESKDKDPTQGTSKQKATPSVPIIIPTKGPNNSDVKVKKIENKKDKKSDVICKFYQNGRCKFEEAECRFKHPRICRKFNQFGPKIGINKGCGENCTFFHPNACKNSIKDRTCSYLECRLS